jgi:hypothetical protein
MGDIKEVLGTPMSISDKIINVLDRMGEDELINIHNAYCGVYNFPKEKIYLMTEKTFDYFFTSYSEAILSVFNTNFDISHKWVRYNGFKLESSNDVRASGWVTEQRIAFAMKLIQSGFGNSEILKLLTEEAQK